MTNIFDWEKNITQIYTCAFLTISYCFFYNGLWVFQVSKTSWTINHFQFYIVLLKNTIQPQIESAKLQFCGLKTARLGWNEMKNIFKS